jgi:hypothetical protein
VPSSSYSNSVDTNVVTEMAGLLLGGCDANNLSAGAGSGAGGSAGGSGAGEDDDSASVRPQILFGDDNALAGTEGTCSDENGGTSERVIKSPWDLPAPFMLSAFGLDDAGGASAILREKQRRQQQQQQQMGEGTSSSSSSSYFSFSTNSPARKCIGVGSTCSNSNSSSNHCPDDDGGGGCSGGIGMVTTALTPYHPHNVLQHQAHQPLPPEQFRNHKYRLNSHIGGDGGGLGGGAGAYEYDCAGRGPMNFPSPPASWYGGGGPNPMHLSGPLYQNNGMCGGGGTGSVWSNAGWAPDTFDIGGLRYPLRNVPLLYSPFNVFQSGQFPPHWQNFQKRHTQY